MELSFHSSIFWWIISLIVIPLESAKVSPGIDHLYASSLHRRAQVLENVASLAIIESTPTISECLVMCMQNKPNCKAINFSKSNATCVLLKESLCSNETYELTENEHFHYYDIMNSPEEEEKHYKDQYCQFYGKCSNKCYPRTRKLILLPEKVEKTNFQIPFQLCSWKKEWLELKRTSIANPWGEVCHSPKLKRKIPFTENSAGRLQISFGISSACWTKRSKLWQEATKLKLPKF